MLLLEMVAENEEEAENGYGWGDKGWGDKGWGGEQFWYSCTQAPSQTLPTAEHFKMFISVSQNIQ